MRTLSLILLACSVLVSSCSKDNTKVAKVGRFEITLQHIKYRNEVERIYNPAETRDLGLLLLGQDFKIAQVLENNEGVILKETLIAEADRIEKETQLPEKLKKIRAIFGSDKDAYLLVYVLPTYARRHLYYDYFLHSPKTQMQSFEKAQQVLSAVQASGKAFCESGKKIGYPCLKFAVSETEGFSFPSAGKLDLSQLPNALQPKDEAKLFIEKVVNHLKPGEVSKEIQNAGGSWRIVRLVGLAPKSKTKYQLEIIDVPKASYQDWLAAEQAKVLVEVRPGYSL